MSDTNLGADQPTGATPQAGAAERADGRDLGCLR